MIEYTPITTRINQNLELFNFDAEQKIGFYFYLGYCANQYARSLGLLDGFFQRQSILSNRPVDYLLPSDFEDEDDLLFDSEDVRSCFLTFAKIIQEEWGTSNRSLSDYINIGHNYLFTPEINEDIWEFNKGKSLLGSDIDEGYLHFFKTLGSILHHLNIKECNQSIYYGRYLYSASLMDDNVSYVYVVDKINNLLPPYLKMIIQYPIQYELNYDFYIDKDEFANYIRICMVLEENEKIADLTYLWYKKSVDADALNLSAYYNNSDSNLGSLLMHLAKKGFEFKYSLSKDDFEEIYNAGGVYKLEDVEGQDVDLQTYSIIIAQLMNHIYGYDMRDIKWTNYGIYLQYLALYYSKAVRYSVYLGDLK